MIGARYHLLAVRYSGCFVTAEDVAAPDRRMSAPYQTGETAQRIEEQAAADALSALMTRICPERRHLALAWVPDRRPIYDRRHTKRAELVIISCEEAN
jgi:hypothetical protein